MFRLLVATTKGGCGKTTTATHLAAALANSGRRTVIADLDRQGSSLGWLARRPADAASIAGLDWSKEIDKPPKGTEWLIIDAPAALKPKQVAELVTLADLIVVPVLPSAFDEAATQRFLKRLDALRPIAKGRKPVAILGNRLRPGTLAGDRLEAFFKTLGHDVIARLRDSQVYVDSARSGLTVFDRHNKRMLEMRSDWQPLLDFLGAAADEG